MTRFYENVFLSDYTKKLEDFILLCRKNENSKDQVEKEKNIIPLIELKYLIFYGVDYMIIPIKNIFTKFITLYNSKEIQDKSNFNRETFEKSL